MRPLIMPYIPVEGLGSFKEVAIFLLDIVSGSIPFEKLDLLSGKV